MSSYFARANRSQRPHAPQWLLLSGAVLCSFSVILLLGLLIWRANKVEEAHAKEINTSPAAYEAPVLVAAADIAEGTALKPQLFRREFWPKHIVPQQMLVSADELDGHFAKALLAQGQPMHRAYLTKVRTHGPLSQDIPKRMRAVTIRVNDLSSVMGMIRPGELVDVSWVHSLRDTRALSVIVEAAKVMAMDQQLDGNWRPGMSVPGTATLLLDTGQRDRVQLAATEGQLILSLRNSEDYLTGGGPPITLKDIPKEVVSEEKKQECNGRLRSCKSPDQCEVLCVLPNGRLVPMGPEYEPQLEP